MPENEFENMLNGIYRILPFILFLGFLSTFFIKLSDVFTWRWILLLTSIIGFITGYMLFPITEKNEDK